MEFTVVSISFPEAPIELTAVMDRASAVMLSPAPATESTFWLAAVFATRMMSPAVGPAAIDVTVMSPAVAVIKMSLASLSLVETRLTASTAPPAVIVIAPFAVCTGLSVTAFVSFRKIEPVFEDCASMVATTVFIDRGAVVPIEPWTRMTRSAAVIAELSSRSVMDCPATESAVRRTPPAAFESIVPTSMLPVVATIVMSFAAADVVETTFVATIVPPERISIAPFALTMPEKVAPSVSSTAMSPAAWVAAEIVVAVVRISAPSAVPAVPIAPMEFAADRLAVPAVIRAAVPAVASLMIDPVLSVAP